MTFTEFKSWLEGFSERRDREFPSPRDWQMIKEKLDQVIVEQKNYYPDFATNQPPINQPYWTTTCAIEPPRDTIPFTILG